MLIQLYSVKVIYFFRAGKAEKEGRWKMKNESVLNCEPTTRQLVFLFIHLHSYFLLRSLTIFMGMKWKYLARILIKLKNLFAHAQQLARHTKLFVFFAFCKCICMRMSNVYLSDISASVIALFFHSRHFLIIEKQSVATAAN